MGDSDDSGNEDRREWPTRSLGTRPSRGQSGPTGALDSGTDVTAATATLSATDEAKSPASEYPPGSRVGRYQVVKVMGSGGMGVVYEAHDPELERQVALKVVRVSGGSRERELRTQTRMLREAHALAQLSHPNVVTVYDCGRTTDGVFIAMELVDGQTLGEWAKAEPRSVSQILAQYVSAGDGLAAAHAAGIVHRDFKPHNVIVGQDGRARVIDFGLARATSNIDSQASQSQDGSCESQSDAKMSAAPVQSFANPEGTADPVRLTALSVDLTQAGTVMGTPRYMSPEQHAGQRGDAASDQYSFCASLYEALAGVPPYAGRTAATIRRNILRGRLQPPVRGRRIPGWLRKVLIKGLSLSPADRYAGMTQLLRPLKRDRRQLWIAAGVAALVVAAIAIPFAMQHGRDQSTMCRANARRVDDLVNGASWGPIERAFKTRIPFAADSVLRTTRTTLDAFIGTWREGYVAACDATWKDGSQSAHLLDLRMACLERKRHKMEALVQTLPQLNDVDTIYTVPERILELSSVRECDDTERLTQTAPLPVGKDAEAKVRAVQKDVDRASALIVAGKFADALPLVAQAIPAAEKLGFAPLLAELYFTKGRAEALSMSHDQALKTLEVAGKHAAASKDLAQLTNTLVSMMNIYISGSSDFAKADVLRSPLEMLLTGVNAPTLRAEYLLSRASLAYEQGKLEVGRKAALEAVEILRRDDDKLLLSRALAQTAPILLDLDDASGAQAMLEEALHIVEAKFGTAHPLMSSIISNLASVSADEMNFEKTANYDKRSLDIAVQTVGELHQRTGIAAMNLGTTYRAVRNFDEAEKLFKRARGIFEKTLAKDHIMIDACNVNFASVAYYRGDFDEAARRYETVLAHLSEVGNGETRWAADAMHPLGLSYIRLGRLDEAGAMLERAVALRKTIYGEENSQVYSTMYGQARLAVARGQDKKAREIIAYVRAHTPKDDTTGTDAEGAKSEATPNGHADATEESDPLVLLILAQSYARGDAAKAKSLATRALAEVTPPQNMLDDQVRADLDTLLASLP